MRKYVNEFLKRGLIFGGFGPIVVGIIYYIISLTTTLALSSGDILVVIISSYLLAFIQAGTTVFNQIEDWSPFKSLAFHFTSLYLAYLGCYLVNSWIPFSWIVVLIFTGIFVLTFLVVWFTCYLITKKFAKKLNEQL